ncbi:hypothetical protein AB0J90_14200 [Micromonospora sp. NPDC049523]|uniref:hypothetical protein n=1 Tax=Micromonospora sp. NPDC049523 TaxID=3155921 RepID=UPI003435FD5B
MTELERRYAGWLRLYPKAYRRARGAEMLAVLMDSSPPDRSRPQWREVRGLILGALRVRAGAHGRRTVGHSWRVSLRTAALMLLIVAGGDVLWQMTRHSVGASLVVVAACVLAMVAVFRGAYLAATVLTAGAFVLDAVARQGIYEFSSSWPLPLAVVLLIPLVGRGAVTAPRSLHLMLLVPLVSVTLQGYGTIAQEPAFQTAGRTVWQTLAVAAIIWSIVDERVTISLGLAFLYVVVSSAASDLVAMGAWSTGSWALIDLAVLATLPVLNIAVGATVAVFRARI